MRMKSPHIYIAVTVEPKNDRRSVSGFGIAVIAGEYRSAARM